MEKERRELAKWKKMKERPMPKGYMALMILVISIVYLLDAMATDLHGGLSELETNYFAEKLEMPYDTVLSLFTMFSAVTLLMNLVAPFYKALVDKIGRKKIFMISTAGMGLGLLLGYFPPICRCI